MTQTAQPVDAGATAGAAALPALLLERAATSPHRVALRWKSRGRWLHYTWGEYAARVSRIGRGLLALTVSTGDRVAIVSENRVAWVLADIAIQGVGATTVAVDATAPLEEVTHVLHDSGAKVVIVDDQHQLARLSSVRHLLPSLLRVVLIDERGVRSVRDPSRVTLPELANLGDTVDERAYHQRAERVPLSGVATLAYTSGATGLPKGAVITHANLLAAGRAAGRALGLRESDEILSILPLSHIAERLVSIVSALVHGYVVAFAERPDSVAVDIAELQPTVVVGAPRLWQRLHAEVELRMSSAGRLPRAAYRHWLRRGARRARAMRHGRRRVFGTRSGWYGLYRPVRTKLGLGRVREAVSTGGPLAPEIVEYFWALGVTLRDAYCLAEASGLVAVAPRDDVRPGSVGRPVVGVELETAPDGEVLLRGSTVSTRYWGGETTVASMHDGWLRSGDVGRLDDDGFLTLVDRSAWRVTTGDGTRLSTGPVERRLERSPYVRRALVVGDGRPNLGALLELEPARVALWASRRRLPAATVAELAGLPEVRELLAAWVEEVNSSAPEHERVAAFAIVPKVLAREDGELTQLAEPVRQVVLDRFANLVEGMYR